MVGAFPAVETADWTVLICTSCGKTRPSHESPDGGVLWGSLSDSCTDNQTSYQLLAISAKNIVVNYWQFYRMYISNQNLMRNCQ